LEFTERWRQRELVLQGNLAVKFPGHWQRELSCTEHLRHGKRLKLGGSCSPFPLSPVLTRMGGGQGSLCQAPGLDGSGWASGLRRKNSPAPLKSSQRVREFLAASTGDIPLGDWLSAARLITWLTSWVGKWTSGDHEDRLQILQPAWNSLLPGQPAVQPRRHPFVLARRQQGHCLQPRRVCVSLRSKSYFDMC
jgi:hypothetical protein